MTPIWAVDGSHCQPCGCQNSVTLTQGLCCYADPDGGSNSSTIPSSCADWEGNNSTLGFGGDLASEAAAINASESEQAPITSFPSGGILPSLRFSVLDHFGNLVSGIHIPLTCCAGLCKTILKVLYSQVGSASLA